MAAEMSQSTYIKDQDIMHDYINRVSKISEQKPSAGRLP